MYSLCRTGLFALCSAVVVAAHADTPVPLPAAHTSVEGITEYRLANGLQVLFVPDNSKPTTTVNVTYRVGSRHENYGETGMAHLLEHLIFKGTPTTRNAFAEFTKRGLRANGTTSFDRTNYFASFAANDDNLRWYLGWQADVMVNSLIAKSDLDSEMTVVRNEMEMGENNPGGVLFRHTLAAMYDWHNYGKATIGARSDVENVDIGRLKAFYRKYYQPDNATLIVAGRFDPDQVLGWIAQSFGALPKPQRVLTPTYTLDPAQTGERTVTVRRVGGVPIIFMAYHLPPAAHPDSAAAELLVQVLGDAPAGRLHKRLVETQKVASVFGTFMAQAEPGSLIVGADLAPGQDVSAARAAMASALDDLETQPVTAAELERARTQWLNGWEQGFTDPERVGVELSSAIAKGDWRLYFLTRNRIRELSLADVQRVAQQWLVPDNRTIGLYLPTEKPRRAPAPARVDVAAQLQGFKGDALASEAETFESTPANLQARLQRSQLAGGLKVGLLPKSTRGQAVRVRLALRYGDQASLQGQSMPLAMMGALLGKGAEGLTRQQISDGFDQLRTDIGFSADAQVLTVTMTSRREQLPAAIALLGRVLRTPRFETDALEEARRQWLAGIAQQRKDPEALVANALARHGNPYPKGDPRHAETFEESEVAVKAVTLADVQQAHARFVSARHGEFAAVGDMDTKAVSAALEAAFGDWASASAAQSAGIRTPPYVKLPQPLIDLPGVRLVLQTPDKQNATMLTQLALPLSVAHPDYAALTVANYMFGGGGNSRLWRRIREKDGLSYDVRSSVDWSPVEPHSTWVSSAIFAPQNQPQVEAAWQQELKRSLDEGFTEAELAEARDGLLNFRRLGRAQDGSVAALLLLNMAYERSFLLSQITDDEITRISLSQVNAVWRKYISPDRLLVAWGGDFNRP